MNDNFLHIFAQYQWHSQAYIIGNTQALKDLRDAIDRALLDKNGSAMSAYTNDGEGYYTAVVCRDDKDEFNKLPLPYTWKQAQKSTKEDATKPWQIAREAIREAEEFEKRKSSRSGRESDK